MITLGAVLQRCKGPLSLTGSMSVLLLLVVGGTITFLGCGSEERSGPSESQFEEASKSVAPGLEEAVEEWASDVPEGAYILVPGYLPFDVEGYTNYLDSNPQYGMYDKEKRGLIIHVIDPNNLAFYERHGTIRIDGRWVNDMNY
jgi:hypothetical protein